MRRSLAPALAAILFALAPTAAFAQSHGDAPHADSGAAHANAKNAKPKAKAKAPAHAKKKTKKKPADATARHVVKAKRAHKPSRPKKVDPKAKGKAHRAPPKPPEPSPEG